MSTIQKDLRYTKEHEWAREGNGGEWTVGITDYAQGELGDVVYVELPEVGRAVQAGQSFGTIEAVKTVSDMYAPVSGKVVAVNDALKNDPGILNREPYGQGWIIKIHAEQNSGADALLDSSAYANLIGQPL